MNTRDHFSVELTTIYIAKLTRCTTLVDIIGYEDINSLAIVSA
jgi:hypothetical protein